MAEHHTLAERLGVQVAQKIDRRSFFRKTAGVTFKAAAVLAAGGALSAISSAPAWADCGGAAGRGCPTVRNFQGHIVSKGCGPSRCCSDTSGLASGCNCASGTSCLNGGHCHGRHTSSWPSSSGCWSCAVVTEIQSNGCQFGYVTTCCDCNTSGCDPDNVCIGVSSVFKKFGC
jgi:hypothetical protein